MNTTSAIEATELTTSYDDVPYPGAAFPGTHPCHLAMVSRFCGIDASPPDQCRVLELGCAIGSNLLPMAASLPNSQFVGVDLSSKQIDQAKSSAQEAGVKNVDFHNLDILDVDKSLGEFDYIICHGVYSWVPHNVQEAILNTAKRQMTDQGVLLVSYNTYPGWHLRGAVRDMMLYHVAELETPKQKVAQARALLKFLVDSSKPAFEAYGTLLKHEAEGLSQRGDHYLYHEHLEEINEPLYFHQFIDRVDAAGLRYLADTSLSMMVAQLFDDSASEILRNVPLVKREQYMDFLRSRAFRSSILCHPSVVPDYADPTKYVRSMHIRLTRSLQAEEKEGGETVWKDRNGGRLTTREPITSAFRRLLDGLPGWVSVGDLVESLAGDTRAEQYLLDSFVSAFIQGLTVLSCDPVPICTEDTEKPICPPYRRHQAKSGRRITSLYHRDVNVQAQQRFLISHMDGTRTKGELAELLRLAVLDGKFRVTRDKEAVDDINVDACRQIVETEIQRLRSSALLSG